MYKYLIFDLDDTLLDFKKAERVAIKSVLEEFGVDSSDKTINLYSAVNKSFWERFERGEIKREEIFEGRFKEFAIKMGIELDTKAVYKRYFEALSLGGYVFDTAEELLKGLMQKYVLCAATNGALLVQRSRIKRSGIEKYFEGRIFISEEMGTKKPQKEFFDMVLKAVGNPKKESVLVLGDSLSSDILGAVNSGLDCCFVNLSGKENDSGLKPTYTVTSLEDIPRVCGLI